MVPPHQSFATTPNGEKIRKRYSISGSQDSFASIAASNEELEAKLKLLELRKRSIQPELLIIGDIYDIKSISIYIE